MAGTPIDVSKYREWETVKTPEGGVLYIVPDSEWAYDPVLSASKGRSVFRKNPKAAMDAQQRQEDLAEQAADPMNQLLPIAGGVAGTVGGAYAVNSLINSGSTAAPAVATAAAPVAVQAAAPAASSAAAQLGSQAAGQVASQSAGAALPMAYGTQVADKAVGAASALGQSVGSVPAAPTLVSATTQGAAPATTSTLGAISQYAGPAVMVATSLYNGYQAMKSRSDREKVRDEVTTALKDRGFSKEKLNAATVFNSPEYQALIDAERASGDVKLGGPTMAKHRWEMQQERNKLKAAGVKINNDWVGGGSKAQLGGMANTSDMGDILAGKKDNGIQRNTWEGMSVPTNVNPLDGGDIKNVDAEVFEFLVPGPDGKQTRLQLPASRFKNDLKIESGSPQNLPLKIGNEEAKTTAQLGMQLAGLKNRRG